MIRSNCDDLGDEFGPSQKAAMGSLSTVLAQPRKSRALSVKLKCTLLSKKHSRNLQMDKHPFFYAIFILSFDEHYISGALGA